MRDHLRLAAGILIACGLFVFIFAVLPVLLSGLATLSDQLQ